METTCIEAWGTYNELARTTGVSEYVLRTGDLSRSSVAQKMSWAATRKTTRIEDRAYSLMGLFGIQIPMLYGEGENAFSRLQEEIIRTTPDDSIFAWRAAWGSTSSYCGLLAKSPDVFEQSQTVDQGRSTFAMSNLGLKIEALLSPEYPSKDPIRFLVLDARQNGRAIGLIVRKLESTFYARVEPNMFYDADESVLKRETLHFERILRIPRQFMSCAMHCLHFEFDNSKYHILSVQPRELWNPDRKELRIRLACIPGRYDPLFFRSFFGMVWLRCNRPGSARPFSLFFAHDQTTGQFWAKLLNFDLTPHEMEWHNAIQDTEVSRRYEEGNIAETSHELQLPWGVLVEIDIRVGLRRGLISYIVRIS